jgi:hypothetical protein
MVMTLQKQLNIISFPLLIFRIKMSSNLSKDTDSIVLNKRPLDVLWKIIIPISITLVLYSNLLMLSTSSIS